MRPQAIATLVLLIKARLECCFPSSLSVIHHRMFLLLLFRYTSHSANDSLERMPSQSTPLKKACCWKSKMPLRPMRRDPSHKRLRMRSWCGTGSVSKDVQTLFCQSAVGPLHASSFFISALLSYISSRFSSLFLPRRTMLCEQNVFPHVGALVVVCVGTPSTACSQSFVSSCLGVECNGC